MSGWKTLDEMRTDLSARFAVRGSGTAFAATHGVSDEAILSLLRGARAPGDAVLAAIGWERQTFYRRVQPCPCRTCTKARVDASPSGDPFDPRMMRMFLCETCGNKRCPHATDHRLACTGSNEPGQAGSAYEHACLPEAPSTPPVTQGEE